MSLAEVIQISSKAAVESFARRNAFNHLFELADLEEEAWRHATYYAMVERRQIVQIALFYSGLALPVLIATPEEPEDSMRELLRALRPKLPARFYAHLAPSQAFELHAHYQEESQARLHRLGLNATNVARSFDTSRVVALSAGDAPEMAALYVEAFPGNQFHIEEFAAEFFFGIHEEGKLVSVAGVHAPCSSQYGVGVIGNVATHPAFRGRGYAKRVTARVCQTLLSRGITVIGLHVQADNFAALSVYEKLGFKRVSTVGAYLMTGRGARVGAK